MSAPATLACGTCGAALAFVGVRTATCPYCASASFLPRAATLAQPEPRFALAFANDAVHARAAVRRWLGVRRLFTDGALRRATVEDLRGVYVPAYLYSAVARTTYSAQIGERYSDTETVLVPGARPPIGAPVPLPDPVLPGQRPRRPARPEPQTETRTITRTEYRPLRGRHFAYITDVLVSASTGLAPHELARLQPFDYRELRRFTPALVAGFVHEEFSRSAVACEHASRAAAVDEVTSRLRRFLPGDSYSDLEHHTTTQWESLDPLLVPVWVLTVRYREHRPPLRVLVNGQTNAVVGRPPLVWWKVLVAAIAVVALGLAVRHLVTRDPDLAAVPPRIAGVAGPA